MFWVSLHDTILLNIRRAVKLHFGHDCASSMRSKYLLLELFRLYLHAARKAWMNTMWYFRRNPQRCLIFSFIFSRNQIRLLKFSSAAHLADEVLWLHFVEKFFEIICVDQYLIYN
uniref:Uncharacterized protein n=1 Tax=Onchocerca volvulus TaxID=6282 RepID=A0A8R1TJA5_ONCVO